MIEVPPHPSALESKGVVSIESSAFSWQCPSCGRRVPRKEEVCRCGHARPSEVGRGLLDPTRRESHEDPARRVQRDSPYNALGWVVAAVLVVALGAMWVTTRPVPVPTPRVAR